MHTIVLALAVLLAQATPAPATVPPAAPGNTATTPAPAGPPGAPGVAAPQRGAASASANAADFGELMSSLNNMRSEIAQIQAMNGTSANNLHPVNVAQLSGSNPSALSSAVARNQSQLNQLRSTLDKVTVTTPSNQRITVAQFLADNKMSVGQIVGAEVKNGTIVLFYQTH